MPGPRDAFYTLLLFAPVLLWGYYRKRSNERSSHPPSPTSLPLVGNLFSLPSGPEHVMYMQIGRQLKSDIVYLSLLGHEIVVLNSSKAASELLDKRSASYSDRFCPLIITDQDLWENQARALLRRLTGVSAEGHRFDNLKDEVVFSMTSSIFQLAYGYTAKEKPDPYFDAAHESDHNAARAAMITTFYVNIFPFLNYIPEWIPGTGWKRTIRAWRKQKDYALDAPFRWTQDQVRQGTNADSIIADLLQDHSITSGLSVEERDIRLKELGHVLFSGGTDTTALLVLSFVAAMVLNPDVQAKAQQEIDLALGSGVAAMETRTPIGTYLADSLRFLIGVFKMMFTVDTGYLRVPLCYWFDGTHLDELMHIFRAITRDESVYVDPEKFNPDRFLDPDVPHAPAFGWGRRKCPGIHFGEASLFITIASLLATFTFSKRKDSSGDDIEPVIENTSDSILLGLKPFELEFAPRSDAHRQLISESDPSH
ncbi:cytochrome P450 family [Rhizoctonia solani]|uniref:Cytochrome P450 family n=1 Tax=Rhizoctonia solani TaxID=456999 RepID=A0A8H7M1D8_9AGAM|nr:cytochrome P450 family [Rhizoctonia solani]